MGRCAPTPHCKSTTRVMMKNIFAPFEVFVIVAGLPRSQKRSHFYKYIHNILLRTLVWTRTRQLRRAYYNVMRMCFE